MKDMIQTLTLESDMLAFGARVANVIENGVIIFLYGPLGAGKTTFTRGFLRGLGYHDKVKSPTYTLVEPYEIALKKVVHFDLYRLSHSNELQSIGIQDYFSEGTICLVEWPEHGFPGLPTPDIACHIDFVDHKRRLHLVAHSNRGDEIIDRLSQNQP